MIQKSTLYVVATPIGNLRDISLRALDVLMAVDVIAAEDTRNSRNLLVHHSITKKMIALHQHNERVASKKVLDLLEAGRSVAYITDVGMSGDYNSVIGMNKVDAMNRFIYPNKKKSRLEVSLGEPTLCGVVIESTENGLGKKIYPIRLGGKLEQTILN